MKYGYARVSRDGQSVDAQMRQLTKPGCEKVFREGSEGSQDRLRAARLDRLARSTRDLLNTIGTIADRKAGFRSLGDTWADTTTSHGRLMLVVLGGLAEFRTRSDTNTHRGRTRARWREA